MHDPHFVRRGKAVRDLDCVVDRFPRRHTPTRQSGPKRLALEQLLDDVRRPLVRSDVVDGRDVRVIQEPRGPGLLLEATQSVGVGRKRRRQNLDRHLAAEPRIQRPVHLAHPACPQRRQDLVRTELRTGSEYHRTTAGRDDMSRGAAVCGRIGAIGPIVAPMPEFLRKSAGFPRVRIPASRPIPHSHIPPHSKRSRGICGAFPKSPELRDGCDVGVFGDVRGSAFGHKFAPVTVTHGALTFDGESRPRAAAKL